MTSGAGEREKTYGTMTQEEKNAYLGGSIENIALKLQQMEMGGSGSGVSAPYSQLHQYQRQIPGMLTEGGNLDTRAQGLRGKHARDKGIDIDTLRKGAKELAEERKETYEQRRHQVEIAIESGKLSSREIVYALEQLTALEKGLVETGEEAIALEAESVYRKEYANMIGSNYEDVFFVKELKEGKWDGRSIDEHASSQLMSEFIRKNTEKFGRDEVMKAIEAGAWDFIKRRREMATDNPRGMGAAVEEMGIEKGTDEYDEMVQKLRGPWNHTIKDTNERIALGMLVKSGLPAELRFGTGEIKDSAGERLGLKGHRDNVQRKLWYKEVWMDGTPWEVSRLSRLLDWNGFMRYARQEKFAAPKLQKEAYEQGKVLLERWWDKAEQKGGFEFQWHNRDDLAQSRVEVGDVIHVKNREDLLKLITDSELPDEIKREYKDKFLEELHERDEFVDEFVNSREFAHWFETTDHGVPIQDVWDDEVMPELQRNLDIGLITHKEVERVKETFWWMADRGTKTEERAMSFHTLVQDVIRDLMGDERRRADLYEEEVDISGVLKTEDIFAEVAKRIEDDPEAVTESEDGRKVNKYPPRSEMGGADRVKMIERIVRSELDREQQVRRAKNELDRVDINKPDKWDLFAGQFDQSMRLVGNFLKGLVFAHSPVEAGRAIRQNRDNIDLMRLNFQDQLTSVDQRKRELQQEIANLQSTMSLEQQVEQVIWSKQETGKGYLDLKDNMEKERRTTYRGLASSKDHTRVQEPKKEKSPKREIEGPVII